MRRLKQSGASGPPAATFPPHSAALPYEHADAYTLSEFYGSARQSRVSLMAEGKVNWGTLRGY